MATRKDFMEVLGMLAVAFAQTETVVDMLLAELIAPGQAWIGYTVASEMSTSRKVKLIERLVGVAGYAEQYRQRVGEFVKAVRKQLSFRNRLIHGFWSMDQVEMGRGFVTVVKPDPGRRNARGECELLRKARYEIADLSDAATSAADLAAKGLTLLIPVNPQLASALEAGLGSAEEHGD